MFYKLIFQKFPHVGDLVKIDDIENKTEREIFLELMNNNIFEGCRYSCNKNLLLLLIDLKKKNAISEDELIYYAYMYDSINTLINYSKIFYNSYVCKQNVILDILANMSKNELFENDEWRRMNAMRTVSHCFVTNNSCISNYITRCIKTLLIRSFLEDNPYFTEDVCKDIRLVDAYTLSDDNALMYLFKSQLEYNTTDVFKYLDPLDTEIFLSLEENLTEEELETYKPAIDRIKNIKSVFSE